MALVALGCRVSRADVDALAAELGGGVDVAREGQAADVVVVNTCSITADAEATARRAIRRAARDHPGAPIVACGCHAEVGPGALAGLPGVAAVVGARSQHRVASVVARLCGAAAPPTPPAAGAAAPARHTRPFLKVQDGCDRRCAYCVVPLARGRSRSTPLDEALGAIAALGARHPEVVLTGVDLAAYGRDLAPRTSLEALVREVARRRLVRRLRLSSVDARAFPRRMLRDRDVAAVLCEHFHLPIQSGSARVLRAMRRPADVAALRRAVEEIAALSPGACVGTDVLAGFPGETEADHRETVALVESLPLAYLHVFPFSARPGTAAAAMGCAVPPETVRARVRELRAVSERKRRAYLAAQVGRELEVVAERVAGGVARGTSRRYVTVRWPSGRVRRGELASVAVLWSDGEECVGRRVPAPPPAA